MTTAAGELNGANTIACDIDYQGLRGLGWTVILLKRALDWRRPGDPPKNIAR
jgi:hypothetical protein